MKNKLNISTRITLADGNSMPLFGLGVWAANPGKEAYNATLYALKKGYRHIDTAEMYGNEKDVGNAIEDSCVGREEIFVTTKLWNSGLGYNHALESFDSSLKKMNLEYIDLYLIHWPEGESQIEAWSALESNKKKGKCKSIGVSNFSPKHLKEILFKSSEKPVVNQIEISPFLQQKIISSYCVKENIHLTGYCPLARGERFDNPVLAQIAKETNKTPAQIMIRWAIQNGHTSIPKSSRNERIEENSNIFNFSLKKEQMKLLNGLEDGLRFCPDPLKI